MGITGAIKGDTRSLDYSSKGPKGFPYDSSGAQDKYYLAI